MGNSSKGVRSDFANVEARCPGRKNLPDAQSLNARPSLSSGSRSFGIAKPPRATRGASFKSSRRFIFLNLRSSIRELRNFWKPKECSLWDSQHTAKLQHFKDFFMERTCDW